METEREREMNEPLAFRTELATALKTAQRHATLSGSKALQAYECLLRGRKANQVLSLIPKGCTGYAEQLRVVKTQFDTVNKLLTDVRDFITQAKHAKVAEVDKSLISMRNYRRTIDLHMQELHAMTND